MAFWNKAMDQFKQIVRPNQEGEGAQVRSNRADGGFSGYQHKVNRQSAQQTAHTAQQAADQSGYSFEHMMPNGAAPMGAQGFQQVGGQTGNMPPQSQAAYQQAQQPQQAYGTGYQQPYGAGYQQPAQGQTGYQQQTYGATGYQQPYQQPQAQQPQQQAWRQQSVRYEQPQQQGDGQVYYMPGTYVGEDGSGYALVMRVAQITGVASCFALIEFMQNKEAAIVNAEQITDPIEADRCMDLLFGAAYAMGHHLTRVSGKQIYLITPAQVQVQPYESLRRMGEDDIDRRWPGAQYQGYSQQAAGGMYHQDDFAGGFGRHAGRQAQAGAYTDYGGFGMRR